MPDFAFRSSADERRAKTDKNNGYPTSRNPGPPGKPIKKRELQDRVMEEQHENISRRFGTKVADQANYGWGVGESSDGGGISVATKVYHPKGVRVITSDASAGDTGAMHRWNKY